MLCEDGQGEVAHEQQGYGSEGFHPGKVTSIFEVLCAEGYRDIKSAIIPEDEATVVKRMYVNPETNTTEEKPTVVIRKDNFGYGTGEESVYLLTKTIKLTDDEAFAIRFQDGNLNDCNTRKSYRGNRLALLLYDAYNNGGCNIDEHYLTEAKRILTPLMPSFNISAFINCVEDKMEKEMDSIILLLRDKDLSFKNHYVIWNDDRQEIKIATMEESVEKRPEGWCLVTFGDVRKRDEWIVDRESLWKMLRHDT